MTNQSQSEGAHSIYLMSTATMEQKNHLITMWDLLDCADSVDEVSKYNSSQVNYLREARIKFLKDDFEVMRYWHERKAHFPLLFTISARVFATPVSSASSEREFSALKLLVSEKRSCLTSSLIDYIFALRSLDE